MAQYPDSIEQDRNIGHLGKNAENRLDETLSGMRKLARTLGWDIDYSCEHEEAAERASANITLSEAMRNPPKGYPARM